MRVGGGRIDFSQIQNIDTIHRFHKSFKESIILQSIQFHMHRYFRKIRKKEKKITHGGSFSELLLPALGRPARFLRAGSHKSSTRTDFLPKETCRLTHGRNCGPSAAALPSSASPCTCGRDNSWWLAAAACCCSPTLVFQ